MKTKIPAVFRPKINSPAAIRAALLLASERSDEVHKCTPTELINRLLREEWERRHPGMMYPDQDGKIHPLPR